MKFYQCDLCKTTVDNELPEYWYKIKKYCASRDAMYDGLLKIGNYYFCPRCSKLLDGVINGKYFLVENTPTSTTSSNVILCDVNNENKD